jgi:hypothetical protein
MGVQLSTSARNARLDQIETTVGVSAKLRIFTGAMPANCAAADSGTKLAEMSLPSDWMAAASAGAKAKLGTWSDVGLAPGNAGYFRIYDSAFAACGIQGTVTATGGGGDMTLDNINIAVGQTTTVNTFTLTDANA